jgi:hypothetical protein
MCGRARLHWPREVEYDDGVLGVHRLRVVCRDRDEEEREKEIIHGRGIWESGRFVSPSDVRLVVYLRFRLIMNKLLCK